MVKKRPSHPTSTTTMTGESPATLILEEKEVFEKLRLNLIEINKIKGIKGYILRNSTTAVIDLQNAEKLIEYALLLSETVESIQSLSALFSLKISNTVVEGKEIKMLCMITGENTLSIFTEKTVDEADILRRISL